MSTSFVTKAEYKAYAGITSTTQDSTIDSLLPKVTALVKNICRRSFNDYVDEAKVENYDGGDFLPLEEFPVIAIQSVEMSTDYGQTYTPLTEYVDYIYHKPSGCIKPIGWSEFPYYPNGYVVTYTAGYETLPEDLKVAVLDLITYYLKNDNAIHSVRSPGSNNTQIEYITTTDLPANIKRVLDLYAGNYL